MSRPRAMAMRSSVKVRKVQEELVCAVCLDILDQPKLLSCAHSFCLKCLGDIVAFGLGGNKDELDCPSCRQKSAIPNGDVSLLRTNFKLQKLVAILSEEDRQTARNAFQIRKQPQAIDTWQLPVCSQHCRLQEFYCMDCNELLCRRCMMDRHRTHNYEEAEMVLRDRLSSLRNLVQPAWEASSTSEKLAGQISEERKLISTNSDSVSAAIKSYFEQMRRLMKEREELLLSTVENHASNQLAKLTTWEGTLNEDRTAILDAIASIESLMERSGDVMILTCTRDIIESLNTHQRSVLGISEAVSQPNRSTSLLAFKENQPIDESIGKMGILISHHSADSSSAKEIALVDRKTVSQQLISPSEDCDSSTGGGSTDIQTDHDNQSPTVQEQQHPPPPSSQTKAAAHSSRPPLTKAATLPYPPGHSPPPKLLERRPTKIPTKEVAKSRTPSLQSNTLIVNEEFQSLIPCASLVQPVAVISTRSREGEIQPYGVAIGDGDSIIVSDVQSHFVRILSRGGKVIDTINIGLEGNTKGHTAVTRDLNGHIFVIEQEQNQKHHQVLKFSNGQLSPLTKFGHKGKSASIQSYDLRGIAVCEADARIYVSDRQNNCIHVLDYNGKILSFMGEGFLRCPAGVAVDKYGHIIVADQDNSCIWVIYQDGKVLRHFGVKGRGEGQLYHPFGVAVASDGSIIVTDSENARVSIFSSSGEFQACFGGKGSEPGQFNHPRHVCMNSKEQIVVADYSNQRIQIFDLKQARSDAECIKSSTT